MLVCKHCLPKIDTAISKKVGESYVASCILHVASCMLLNTGSKVVMPRSGSGDKLPLLIKCVSWRASQVAFDNRIQLLAFTCGLATEPGGTVSTDRRRGKGGPLAP